MPLAPLPLPLQSYIADRLGVTEDRLEFVPTEDRQAGNVGVGFAAAVAETDHDGQTGDQDENDPERDPKKAMHVSYNVSQNLEFLGGEIAISSRGQGGPS